MFSFHSAIGLTAGALSLLGFIPYLRSTLHGKNRPNRATWIIWFSVSLLLLASYRAAGATDSIWTAVACALLSAVIMLLSFKYGEGGWRPLDKLCLALAAFGLGLWWYFESPLPTLYLSILIDFIGAIPTLQKSFVDPQSENKTTWFVFWIANSLNLLAIRTWSVPIASYPVYLFFISGTIFTLLEIRGRGKLRDNKPTQN